MPTPASPNIGADFTNQFISDKYTSLLHLSAADMTSNNAPGAIGGAIDYNGVYDGLGNYTGIGFSKPVEVIQPAGNVYINNLTMPRLAGEGVMEGSGEAIAVEAASGGAPMSLYDYLFPVGTIWLTINDSPPKHPGALADGHDPGWKLISRGRFLAGVSESDTVRYEEGSGKGQVIDGEWVGDKIPSDPDRNGEVVNITPGFGINPENGYGTGPGEYTHTQTEEEMPSHKHDVHARNNFRVGRTNGTDKTVAGTMAGLDTIADTTYAGGKEIDGVTEVQASNNMPPFFGVYVWERVN